MPRTIYCCHYTHRIPLSICHTFAAATLSESLHGLFVFLIVCTACPSLSARIYYQAMVYFGIVFIVQSQFSIRLIIWIRRFFWALMCPPPPGILNDLRWNYNGPWEAKLSQHRNSSATGIGGKTVGKSSPGGYHGGRYDVVAWRFNRKWVCSREIPGKWINQTTLVLCPPTYTSISCVVCKDFT